MKQSFSQIRNNLSLLAILPFLFATCMTGCLYAQHAPTVGGGSGPGEDLGSVTPPQSDLTSGSVRLTWENPNNFQSFANFAGYCVNVSATQFYGETESVHTAQDTSSFLEVESTGFTPQGDVPHVIVPFQFYAIHNGETLMIHSLNIVLTVTPAEMIQGAIHCVHASATTTAFNFTGFVPPGGGGGGGGGGTFYTCNGSAY